LKKKKYSIRNWDENLLTDIPGSTIRLFQRLVLEWYSKHGRQFPWRNKSASCYRRIVVEVLLQRTRAENVASFFSRFIHRYPSWKKLASATERDLGSFLQPLGLWKRRSSSLLGLAREVAKRNGRFPKTREEIEFLPNVGQYIANAILLFCQGEPQPLLDSNMARVLERFFGPRKLADIRYDPYLQVLARTCVRGQDPVSMNWGILDFAALVCTQRLPRHDVCPLRLKCVFIKKSLGAVGTLGSALRNWRH